MRLVDHILTFRTSVGVFQVLHDARLAERVETFGHRGRINQIPKKRRDGNEKLRYKHN